MPEEIPHEYLYCPECKCLHVDLQEWAHKRHHKHLCERCGHIFDEVHHSFGINLPRVPLSERVPHRCGVCHAVYRTRGSIDEGEVPVRNVCVCEVTAKCDTCGAGFVVQRDVHDDRENPLYRCRACARGLVDPIVPPVARTGPVDLHDIDEHIEFFLKKDKRRLHCEACSKTHVAARSTIQKTWVQGYLFGCPTCGDTELVLAVAVETPEVPTKKPSIHWRRRVRRIPSTEGSEGEE